ncbi:hypothetical protein E4U42_003780 [Claviceps africana]|uniref:C2H2-type domain-containing protein n=1 Tax=Claviceps africana TaxID=83212 RepID=A0A8K0NLB0_9HYPO|nr:hypothetical protein E4U42_003780 [Claviceps africana]
METLQTDAPPSTTVRLPPPSDRESSDDDPTWQGAPGVETWGSSTDDDDTDDDDDDDDDIDDDVVEVVEVVKRQPQTNTTLSNTNTPARPQLSDYTSIISAHKKWLENKTAAATAATTASASSTISNGLGTKTDSPGPANYRMETPVPLPPHPLEALYNKPGGSFKRLPGGGIKVSFNPTPAQLKKRLAESAAKSLSSTPVTPVPLPSLTWQRESSAASASKQSAVSLDGSQSWSPTSVHIKPQPILLATDNTPYSSWTNAHGVQELIQGGLIPAGYSLYDDRKFRFVCSIRSCRRLLPDLFHLGHHFRTAHNHTVYNDNLDGTLTQVGKYDNGKGNSPCIVVSQSPAPPGAPPPIEGQLPNGVIKRRLYYKQKQAAEKRAAEKRAAEKRAAEKRAAAYDQENIGAKRRMTDASSSSAQSAAARDHGASAPRGMLSPKLFTIRSGRLERLEGDFLLDHLGRVISAPAPSSRQDSNSTMGTGPAIPRSSNASPAPSPKVAPQDAPELTLAGRRSIRQSVLARLQADKDVSGSRPFTRSPSVQQDGAKYGQSNQSEQQPDHEMEDWEIAPGRVTSKDSSQNVAFSGTFLASSTPIAVCPDISFNVLTIRPGQIHRTTIHGDKMQMYSLACGKVQVTTGGQTVQLGPNGAFPLRPGERCIIENRLYTEATLHCTTVSDYEMNSAD